MMIVIQHVVVKSFIVLVGGYGMLMVCLGQQGSFADLKQLGITTECRISTADTIAGVYSDSAVRAAYTCALATMRETYGQSGLNIAGEYDSWVNFSTSPYLSQTHANRYVNNYANPIAAKTYGSYGEITILPVGSILAKDSFSIDQEGFVVIGALYLMEKMPIGYNLAYNNWRYTMILPDGMVFTSRGSIPSPSVKFCGDCHQEVGIRDSLFFVPEKYRSPPE